MILFALVVGSAADAQAIASEAREILATGDEIDGFGRIGGASFEVVGITADDRVVFKAQTSTGAEGVFLADENGVESLWLATDPTGFPVRIGRARTNANGVVVAEGFATTDIFNEIAGFYRVGAGAALPVIEVGDITPDGDEICFVADFALSDTGAVGFSAYATPSEPGCGQGALSESLYVSDAGSVRTLLRNTMESSFVLIGLTDDDTLLVGLSDGSAILRVSDDRVENVVSSTDQSPGGTPFGFLTGAAANSLGEVAFSARRTTELPTLYRTEGGEVHFVVASGNIIADEYVLDTFCDSTAALNDAGSVVIRAQLRHPVDESIHQSAILLPAAGERRLLARTGRPGGINDRGVAGVLETNNDGDAVSRGTGEPLAPLVAFGDAAPDGGVFATGGILGIDLAPDGRVLALVRTGDFSVALACGDAERFVALTGPHQPARGGNSFLTFGGSAFTEAGVLFLGAHAVRQMPEWNVYRAGADGFRRLAGPEDVTVDGSRIEVLLPFADQPSPGSPEFASNALGTLLVRARTNDGIRFLRRRAAGRLESVSLDAGPEVPDQRVVGAGIRDDDTVVVSVQLVTGEYAILTSDGTSVDLLAMASDPNLPGGPFDFLALEFVIGDRIVLRGNQVDSGEDRTILYTAADGFVPFFADGVERRIEDATVGGRALVEPIGEVTQFLLSPDGRLSQLSNSTDLGVPRATAINDRDNVLFTVDVTALGTFRSSLSLSGPTPSAQCPGAPVAETPTPTATQTPTETPAATETSTPTHTLGQSHTPTATPTVSPGQTVSVTQTAARTPTAVVAKATVADPFDSDDGCQVTPSSRTSAWPLLPLLAVLARCSGKLRSRRKGRRTRRSSMGIPDCDLPLFLSSTNAKTLRGCYLRSSYVDQSRRRPFPRREPRVRRQGSL